MVYVNTRTPEEFLELLKNNPPIIIDIRERNQFLKGHIPNAINIPIFNQAQRDAINSYRTRRVSGAYLITKITEFIKPNLETYISELKSLISESKDLNQKSSLFSTIFSLKKRKILVYCSTFDEESQAFANVVSSYNLQFFVLKGGYKAFQKTTNKYLFQDFTFRVIGGRIGSGKTAILYELQKVGEQILDLEKCADHSGTVFGTLGKNEQAANKQYMTAIGLQLSFLDPNRPIWVEEKPRNLGKYWMLNRTTYLPVETESSMPKYKYLSAKSFWNQIMSAPIYRLELPIELRLKRIIEEYSKFSIDEIKEKATKLLKKLGYERYVLAVKYLESGNVYESVQIILEYYDSYYDRTIHKRSVGKEVHLDLQEDSPEITARRLINEVYGNES